LLLAAAEEDFHQQDLTQAAAVAEPEDLLK
jgi:hypothetical protein